MGKAVQTDSEARSGGLHQVTDRAREDEVLRALEACGGCVTHAAEELRVSRRTLTKLLGDYDLVERAREMRRKAWGRRSAMGRPPR